MPQLESQAAAEHLEVIRRKLVGHAITNRRVAKEGINPNSKGKWGQYVERRLGLALNNSALPDFGSLGELKTVVRNRAGRFRDSIKICMDTLDPLAKLSRVILVIARDCNGSATFAAREVRVEEVVLLEPTTVLRHALESDVRLLRSARRSRATYFLEKRTAGAKGSRSYAYYLKYSRVEEYVEGVRKTMAFREVRSRLKEPVLTARKLSRVGYRVGAKGKFGNYVRSVLPAASGFVVRTGVVDVEGGAKEDLLICSDRDDPVEALRGVIYVPMKLEGSGRGVAERRRILDVMYLGPNELALHVLQDDKRLVRRGMARRALFLRRKTHYGMPGNRTWSWYIKSQSVRLYSELLRNQPV